MSVLNSAGVKFNNNTELVIKSQPDGEVTSCFNIINNTEYVNGRWNWMGEDPDVVLELDKDKIYLKDTGFDSWTPSTTQTSIRAASVFENSFTYDANEYEYIILDIMKTHFEYTSDTAAARILEEMTYGLSTLYGAPANYDQFIAGTKSTLATGKASYNGMIYVNSSLANAYTLANSGIYQANPAMVTISGSTVKLSKPIIYAKCDSTVFSTTQAAAVDKDKSYIEEKIIVYRLKAGTSDVTYMSQTAIKDIYENGVPD